MTARLTTDEYAPELNRPEMLAARDSVMTILDSQLNTSIGLGVRAMLLEKLGERDYRRLLLDLAGNVIQGLL